MKKLTLTLFAVFMLQACFENQKKTETETNSATEQLQSNGSASTRPAQQNEILQEMHDMMDEMHSKSLSGHNGEDCAEMMSDHHDGAVEMSGILLRKGKDEELKNFARQVIKTQR